MLYAFVVAVILITLAELGDKTQLLVLALAARYKAWQVFLGIFVGALSIHLLSTLAGQLLGDVIPRAWLGIATGVLFVGFGVWTLRGEKDHEDSDAQRAGGLGPVLTTAIAFFLAELGDKTQIMSMTIAADPAAVLRTLGAFGPAVRDALAAAGITADGLTPAQTFAGVWLGSTFGMLIADGAAILVGRILGKKLPERLITRISGIIFIVFGVLTLLGAWLGR